MQVVIPGRYLVMVNLIKNDRIEGYADKTVDLKPGDATVTVEFNRATLLRLDEDGPYNLSAEIDGLGEGLRKYTVTSPPLLARSRAYSRASFDPGPIYFTKAISTKPLSANGQPPFDRFSVSFDVVTPGGECAWFTSLAGNNKATSVVSGNGTLPKGHSQATLIFDKWDMAKMASSPMKTRATQIHCGSQFAELAP